MKWFNRIAAVCIVLVLLSCSAVWLVSPWLSNKILSDVLASEQIELSDSSSVRLNLFLSRLSIDKLIWKKGPEESFRLDRLTLKYSLLKLLFKEVSISELSVSGMQIYANVTEEGRINVAGFSLSQSDEALTDEGAQDASDQDANPEGEAELALLIDVKRIRFSDISIIINNQGYGHKLLIEQLAIDESSFDQGVLSTNISLQARIDNAKLDIDSQLSLKGTSGDISIKGGIEDVQLSNYSYLMPLEGRELQSLVELSFDSSIQLDDATPSVHSKFLNLIVRDVNMTDSDILAELKTLSVQLSDLSVVSPDKENFQTTSQVGVLLQGLNVIGQVDKGTVLALDEFKLEPSTVESNLEQFTLAAPALSLKSLVLSKPHNDLPEILNLETLAISEITLNETGIALSEINIGAIQATILQGENGVMENGVAFLFPTEPPVDESLAEVPKDETKNNNQKTKTNDTIALQEGEEALQTSPFSLQLSRVFLSDPAKIKVVDASINPKLDKQFVIDTLNVSDITNLDLEQKSSVAIELNDGEYFTQKIEGWIQPFKDKVNMEFITKGKEFSLHEISPYVASAMNFEVQAGQLDSNISLNVKDSIMDAKVEVYLRGPKFAAAGGEDGELDVIGQTAIPMNVALNMLKDKKGNIKLTIPVKGDINDPSFGLRYIMALVVKKAVMSQAKNYLLTTFVPYAQVVSVAMSAGSYALKVRFQDMEYQVQQQEILAPQAEYIDQFVTLMKQKEALQVRVCPVSVVADLPEAMSLNDEGKIQLRALAKQRAQDFKRVVTEKGIDSSRLHICTPKIEEDAEAKPRIELSI